LAYMVNDRFILQHPTAYFNVLYHAELCGKWGSLCASPVIFLWILGVIRHDHMFNLILVLQDLWSQMFLWRRLEFWGRKLSRISLNWSVAYHISGWCIPFCLFTLISISLLELQKINHFLLLCQKSVHCRVWW
jgi:hypothetical protein